METLGGTALQPVLPRPPMVQHPVQPRQPVFGGSLLPPVARVVMAGPGNLTHWRGRIGERVTFAVTGSQDGKVWADQHPRQWRVSGGACTGSDRFAFR